MISTHQSRKNFILLYSIVKKLIEASIEQVIDEKNIEQPKTLNNGTNNQ